MTEPRQLLTSPQVAEILGVSVRTVQRLARTGDLKANQLSGQTGAYVFDPSDVEIFQLRQSMQASA